MTGNDNSLLIVFLKTLKRELLALTNTLKTKMLKRSDLENVFIFQIAPDENKEIIHRMVDEVKIEKEDILDTGQESIEVLNIDQALDEPTSNERGTARRYTSSHFKNNQDAA